MKGGRERQQEGKEEEKEGGRGGDTEGRASQEEEGPPESKTGATFNWFPAFKRPTSVQERRVQVAHVPNGKCACVCVRTWWRWWRGSGVVSSSDPYS